MGGQQHPAAPPWQPCRERRDQSAGRDIGLDETDPPQRNAQAVRSRCAAQSIAVKSRPPIGVDPFDAGGGQPPPPVVERSQRVEQRGVGDAVGQPLCIRAVAAAKRVGITAPTAAFVNLTPKLLKT
jgi:hypothetical protein